LNGILFGYRIICRLERDNVPDVQPTQAMDSNNAEPLGEAPHVIDEAHALATEVIRRLLVWMADAPTLLDRGLRATVALHCLRPDLLGAPTFARIGDESGRSPSRVHRLAGEFRVLMGETFKP
jgi:hypothetical protein